MRVSWPVRIVSSRYASRTRATVLRDDVPRALVERLGELLQLVERVGVAELRNAEELRGHRALLPSQRVTAADVRVRNAGVDDRDLHFARKRDALDVERARVD